jgi:DNA mismatch endonuclease (patch repair protein)
LDRFDKATRSRVMSRSKSSGTRSTEWKFRSLLMRSGIAGWKLGHKSGLAGNPDVLFGPSRIAIFLDGCFWHGCTRCRSIPATNRRFWTEKIQGNRKRDKKVVRMLRDKGWKSVRIWEHELKADTTAVLRKVLNARSQNANRAAS